MAATLFTTTGAALNSPTRTVAFTFYSGVPVANDVVVAFIATVPQTITAPAGWTQIAVAPAVDVQIAALYHIVTTAEAAVNQTTFTLTNVLDSPQTGVTIAAVVRDADADDVIDGSGSAVSTVATTTHALANVPGAQLSHDGGLVISCIARVGGTLPSAITGWTQARSLNYPAALHQRDAPSESGVDTGATTFTASPAARYADVSVVITPAPVPPPSGTAGGAYAWSSSSAGQVHPRGAAATAEYTWETTAEAIPDPPPEGAGAGAYAWSSAAAGGTERRGEGTAQYTISGTAVGAAEQRGMAGSAYTWASSAAGAQVHGPALTAGTYTFAGTAAGVTIARDEDNMTVVTGQTIADFLGQGDDDNLVALAGDQVPIIAAMVSGYTRGRGFTAGEPDPEIAAVITTATARMVANPEQINTRVGNVYTSSAFTGFTLAETFVLNKYRVRSA